VDIDTKTLAAALLAAMAVLVTGIGDAAHESSWA
jgi:hypothetical protein